MAKKKKKQNFGSNALEMARKAFDSIKSGARSHGLLPFTSPLQKEPDVRVIFYPKPTHNIFNNIPTPTATPFPSPIPSPTSAPILPRWKNYRIAPNVQMAITKAANKYDIDPNLLFDISAAESSFDPLADPARKRPIEERQQFIDAGYPAGLFQITDSTISQLKEYAKNPQSTLDVPNYDRFNPETNALMAAYLIKQGQLGRWNASYNKWGQHYSPEKLVPYYSQTKLKDIPENIKSFVNK